MEALKGNRILFVGLGNPEKKYEQTRHNLGFRVIQEFAKEHECTFKNVPRFESWVAKDKIGERELHLLLPTTYMNESGRAVRKYSDYYQIESKDILIVTDDVAIPLGQQRLRLMGSSGGHNGLKSVETYLKTATYPRLRMGIGKADHQGELSDYVLGKFSKEEQEDLPKFIEQGANTLNTLLTDDIHIVMNRVNKKQG